jgi:antitoxin ParD1/3/4
MAKIAILHYDHAVSTMNVSLPDELRSFVDRQVDQGHYGSTSEYVRALIRRDQDRQRLRTLLLEGAESDPGPLADADYFASIRRGLDAAG